MKFEMKSAVMPLIAANVIVFLLELFLGNKFINLFILSSGDVFTRPWILVTHLFLHAGIYHLLLNMWALVIFGPLLEQKIGAKRFLSFYILAGIAAGFVSSFFYSSSLGASGAIMGVTGVMIILVPELPLLLFFVIPMPLWIAGILFAAIDLLGIVFPSGIGSIAHLTGLGAGLLYGMYLKKQSRSFQKKFSSRKHLGEVDVDEYLRSGRI